MKTKILVVLVAVVSAWCGIIYGMERQAELDRNIGLVDNIPWSAHYDDDMWVDVVEQMERSESSDLRVAAIVSREGYRLGVANGQALCMAEEVRRGRD